MIVEYLRYKIEQDRQDQFVADYQAASVPLLAAPQSLSFDLCQCVEDPAQFILRIEWTSAEVHLKGFRGSPAFRDFLSHIKPYIVDLEEMRHYTRRIPS